MPPAPLAFVYDRCASRSHSHLDMRLIGCDAYADRRGWVLAGRWLDLGDHALSEGRPQLAALIENMRETRRPALCLIHNWGRLAVDNEQRLLIQQRIARAGGSVVTTFDESDILAHRVLAGGCRA